MSNRTQHLALIGFGTVGQALAKIIQSKHADLKYKHKIDLNIVAVSSLSKGSLYNPHGLDIDKLLTAAKSGSFDAYPNAENLQRGWDNIHLITDTNADTIIEVSYTDMDTAQPALNHCRTALAHGKNIVTSNKGPIALAYADLQDLACANNAQIFFESTVMAGTPSLRLASSALAGNDISAIQGIFNGTSNYILSQMEEGISYADALATAQKLGYAEADPTADVEGIDAMAKVLILANTLMDCSLNKDDVSVRGIAHLRLRDIEKAKAEGKRWKLIGSVEKLGGQVQASVQPVMLPIENPLAQVMDTANAITYRTDLLGEVTLVGAGAGGTETAAGLLSDILAID